MKTLDIGLAVGGSDDLRIDYRLLRFIREFIEHMVIILLIFV